MAIKKTAGIPSFPDLDSAKLNLPNLPDAGEILKSSLSQFHDTRLNEGIEQLIKRITENAEPIIHSNVLHKYNANTELENGNNSIEDYEENKMADINWQEKYFDEITEAQRQERTERAAHRQEMQDMRRENHEIRVELQQEFRALHGEINTINNQMHSEIDTLKTQMHTSMRSITITAIVGIAALVLPIAVALLIFLLEKK